MPAAAHVFELPGKIDLPQQDYFVVQQIYRGWAWFGVVIIAAAMSHLVLALIAWRRRTPALLHALAFVAITGSLVVFFVWVYPANQATQNWTVIPAEWAGLRRHWEFGHTAGAALIFLAFVASLLRLVLDHAISPQRGDLGS